VLKGSNGDLTLLVFSAIDNYTVSFYIVLVVFNLAGFPQIKSSRL
jgi:hypothetical protein